MTRSMLLGRTGFLDDRHESNVVEIDLTADGETRAWIEIAHEVAACTDAEKLLELVGELIEAIDNCPGLLPSKMPRPVEAQSVAENQYPSSHEALANSIGMPPGEDATVSITDVLPIPDPLSVSSAILSFVSSGLSTWSHSWMHTRHEPGELAAESPNTSH
jgi:hypothetical protein